jgi:hypothetical protein
MQSGVCWLSEENMTKIAFLYMPHVNGNEKCDPIVSSGIAI